MASTFQPRQVEPGALKRWALQAVELLRRSPLSWLLCGTAFLGLGVVASRSWFGMALLGMWCHVHFQLMANRADRGSLHLAGVPGYFGASLLEMVLHFRRTPVTAYANVLVLCLAPAVGGFNPFYYSTGVDQPAVFDAATELAALGTALMLGSFLLSVGMGFMNHGFMLSRISGAGFVQLMGLTRAQREKNGFLGVSFDIIGMCVATLAMVFPPVLALAAPFLGAWAYVSFRDIYLHQDGNQALAKASAPVLAAAGAA